MDLEELKRILQKDRGKIIIVENGKPLMVVLPYESSEPEQEPDPEPPKGQEDLEPEPAELTIDDLPI